VLGNALKTFKKLVIRQPKR